MRNPAAPTIGRPVLASLGAAAAVGVVVFGVGAVDADAGWVVGTGIFGTVAGVLQWLVRKGQVHGRAGLAHLGGDGRSVTYTGHRMVLDFTDLRHHRGRLAMVAGAFDPLHDGHIEYFRQARALGAPLLCSIASDDYVASKHRPLLPASQRALVVDALSTIDFTLVSDSDTETVLRELRPRRFIKGRDWLGRLPANEQRVCAEHGTEVVFLDTVLNSSTRLLRRYRPEAPEGPNAVSAFEEFVGTQRPTVSPGHDGTSSVHHRRREHDAYAAGSRPASDGKYPELIKEVFQPERVLDVDSGPEALPRLPTGTMSDAEHFADAAYDLVICRDVMEHLSVLQVRETVHRMCRISSRYVCITTRFHPDPSGLLDVTTQGEVDASYTTFVQQEFLAGAVRARRPPAARGSRDTSRLDEGRTSLGL